MKVRLVWIETNFRNEELSRREELLEGESQKKPTGNSVVRLIARYHPELRSVDRVHLLESHRPDLRWYIRSNQLSPNCWESIYAEPVEDIVAPKPAAPE